MPHDPHSFNRTFARRDTTSQAQQDILQEETAQHRLNSAFLQEETPHHRLKGTSCKKRHHITGLKAHLQEEMPHRQYSTDSKAHPARRDSTCTASRGSLYTVDTVSHIFSFSLFLCLNPPGDDKIVHVVDVQSGKELGKPLQHTIGVAELALEQGATSALARHLAFVDKNRSVGNFSFSFFLFLSLTPKWLRLVSVWGGRGASCVYLCWLFVSVSFSFVRCCFCSLCFSVRLFFYRLCCLCSLFSFLSLYSLSSLSLSCLRSLLSSLFSLLSLCVRFLLSFLVFSLFSLLFLLSSFLSLLSLRYSLFSLISLISHLSPCRARSLFSYLLFRSDLYLVQARRSNPKLEKLSAMVQGMMWHDSSPMLATLGDGKFTAWLYPR